MRVIIAGCRDFSDYAELVKAITESGFHAAISEVVSGCAPGVDALGEQWAVIAGLPIKRFPADWRKHGRAAGPIRNAAMADYAEALIALWDGDSPGTENMIETAKRQGLRVYVHRVRSA